MMMMITMIMMMIMIGLRCLRELPGHRGEVEVADLADDRPRRDQQGHPADRGDDEVMMIIMMMIMTIMMMMIMIGPDREPGPQVPVHVDGGRDRDQEGEGQAVVPGAATMSVFPPGLILVDSYGSTLAQFIP